MRSTQLMLKQLGKTFKLTPKGNTWQGVGPFLYVNNHFDAYPKGNGKLGPDPALLEGRVRGNDFKNPSGWSMYMGGEIPGFPAHPHKGMETITIVKQGAIDHADSTHSGARYAAGDVQWVTAGKGVMHSEMFPLLNTDSDNPVNVYQLWLNMAKEDKGADPEFVMMWREAIPRVERDGATVTVIAGKFEDVKPLTPPRASWASRKDSDLAVWFVELESGANITLPATNSEKTKRTLYVHGCGTGADDAKVKLGDEWVPHWYGVAQEPGSGAVAVENGDQPARIVVLQAVPIGEPVAIRGPFVMNTEQENIDGFAEYRKTHFGGFPWPSDQPNYGPDSPRFAQYPDGRKEFPDKMFS